MNKAASGGQQAITPRNEEADCYAASRGVLKGKAFNTQALGKSDLQRRGKGNTSIGLKQK
jgi:hypothetical protein